MENTKPFVARKIDKSNIISLQKGKIPPQAIDLEEVVLGAMMIDKKGVDEVIDILHPDVFYKDAHRFIYEAIFILFEESQPIDLLTVSSQLKKAGKLEVCGGDFYLIKLTQKVASSAHIEFHARIILQKFIQRSLIKISGEIIEEAYDEAIDVFDLLDTAEAKLYDVTQGNLKRSAETAQDLVIQAKKRIEEIAGKEGMSGVASGFDKLDKLTSGWQPSDLIIVAARPGMGKTAFTLSMARNMAVNTNTPVAFFSLEMSSVQLITRLISSETGLSSEKLRTGKLEKHEWEQLNVKVKTLEKAPLFIDDTPSLSIFDLRAKARRLASQHGIKMIMIDYLQLMTAGGSQKGGNREQEISTISRNLKALAKELNVPVIALSQLSRAVETRGGSKRPILSDLRESGAIEQDADIVSFIYRPEYYKIEEWDDEERTPTQGQGEFIVAKHRNGGLENIRLKFIGNQGKFDNLDDFDSPFEFQSKMNANEENPFATKNLPSADDAFGSSMNSSPDLDEDNDVPF
ncbi:primary replicative DNA helicase [Maribacter caenipelagi]|uniref:Replicative DNA helicase n=2 Tax=Maribacter TaxID=252356 RepID=A0A1I6IPZ0_9FLAO|nr:MULTISPECIES: replicative DNA helicase [Maribacter]TDS17128.1 primary replicative DNA helicase [Maribacter caenipelagi]SFR68817.1 primary replicative DNA helicase [Maribacter stanieri]|tara:strand:- start:930 stop:2480 length:1551 start_codon:yes stop_codon:yes gene_type:complete|eukprot:TRINITY_DN1481_c0_g1_i2.p1 TRINITY_DN1481_c0_g1~~TRINITY_DN1481_c0_g1_i2.p1  ORF type:complete len:517 (+),score=119.70 TRINITY_DN1481_c0_g1_i2:5146-6696(+)